MLVGRFLVELFGELRPQVVHLPLVLFLIRLQTFVDLLALINSVLLVVLDFLVNIAELLLENTTGLVTEAHQLVEFVFDLIHLVVQASDLRVFNFRGFVHF